MQTFTAREYLKIDIANNFGFGLDKKTWLERITWFDTNEKNLPNMLNKASEPALFFAGLQAWEAAKNKTVSGYPVSLDATSSGLQLLSCLTGDRSAALLCNVIPFLRQPLDFSEEAEVERRDGYTVIYEYMLTIIGGVATITRDQVKDAIMTSLYGSKAEPKKVFGEGALLATFYSVMKTLAPAAWELNEAFIDIWDDAALIHSWVLPDNFHVHVPVMDNAVETVHFLNTPYDTFRKVNMPKEQGRSLGANGIHSLDGMVVREMVRRCDYDPVKVAQLRAWLEYLEEGGNYATQMLDTDDAVMLKTLLDLSRDTGYLSARVLDHITLENMALICPVDLRTLLDSLPAKPFKVITVHDCFRCLPNYCNDLRKQYNLQLYLIYKSDILSHMLSQMTGRSIKIGKLDTTMGDEILNTNYSLS